MPLIIRIVSVTLLVVLLPLHAFSHSAMDRFWGEVPVDMLISGDVLITRPLIVPEDVTLTIEPGTVVRFEATANEDNRIVVRGRLIAVGTDEKPVRFVPKEDGGVWFGLEFMPGASGRLERCVVEGSTAGVSTGGPGVDVKDVEVRR